MHDITQAIGLLDGLPAEAVLADKAYDADGLLAKLKETGAKVVIPLKSNRNKKHASIRAKVEPIFRIVKCQLGYRKTRHKGLAKNAAQVFSLMALANLYQARAALLAAAG